MSKTKKKKNKIDFATILLLLPYVIVPLLVIAFIIFRVIVFIKYGNTPITEIPAWVYWIMRPSSN